MRPRTGRARVRRSPELPLPKRPYRDSVLFYAVLSLLLVGVAYATGGDFVRAVLFAAGFFVIATAWSWWRFRSKLQEARLRAEPSELAAEEREQ